MITAEILSTTPRLVDVEVKVAITSDQTGYTSVESMVFAPDVTQDAILAAVQSRVDALTGMIEASAMEAEPMVGSVTLPSVLRAAPAITPSPLSQEKA